MNPINGDDEDIVFPSNVDIGILYVFSFTYVHAEFVNMFNTLFCEESHVIGRIYSCAVCVLTNLIVLPSNGIVKSDAVLENVLQAMGDT